MAPEGGVGQLKKSGAQASEEIVEGLAVCGNWGWSVFLQFKDVFMDFGGTGFVGSLSMYFFHEASRGKFYLLVMLSM